LFEKFLYFPSKAGMFGMYNNALPLIAELYLYLILLHQVADHLCKCLLEQLEGGDPLYFTERAMVEVEDGGVEPRHFLHQYLYFCELERA
jgi:hypothetical protein